jgi:hypothetical protein
MAVIDWAKYNSVLDGLRLQRSAWEAEKDYRGFSDAIDRSCAELRGGPSTSYGDLGLDSLRESLSENLGDEDQVYEQIRLVTLAEPAPAGFGEAWLGFFISSRRDGEQVRSADQFAAPSSWANFEPPGEESAENAATQVVDATDDVAPGLTFDEVTGMFFDESNWYLPDGVTNVTRLGSSDVFVDDARIRYRLGEPFQWYDQSANLLYDDSSWYLPDGATIVTEVGESGIFADSAGHRYRGGEIFQWFDPGTALLYDDAHWYLADGTTIVTEVENADLFADAQGNFYRLGQLVVPEPALDEPALAEDTTSRDEDEETELEAAITDSIERHLEDMIDEIRQELELDEDEISDEEIFDIYLAEVRSLLEQ